MRYHTQAVRIYETMCKPYLTAQLTINDTNNAINALQLRGGERVAIVLDPGLGKVYETVQYILQIDEQEDPQNFRSKIYQISTASESFFNDRAGMVQRSDSLIPHTSAAEAIHSEYIGTDAPLNIALPSLGMIAKQEIGGFITANKKPFKAIGDILARASYGGFKTGSTVYFRNAQEYVMAPLEYLFATMGSQERFIQRQTWGAHWEDVFGGGPESSYRAIIRATTKVKEGDKQVGGAAELAAAAKGALNVWDVTKGSEVVMQAASLAAAVANPMAGLISQFGKGKYGGIPNVLQLDTRRNEASTDQSLNMVAQNMFQAQVKDSVNYYIKVPIQTGINVTVGRGFTAKLIPPTGDLNKGTSLIGGLMLAADVCHEAVFTDALVQGTTSIRGVQINYG